MEKYEKQNEQIRLGYERLFRLHPERRAEVEQQMKELGLEPLQGAEKAAEC